MTDMHQILAGMNELNEGRKCQSPSNGSWATSSSDTVDRNTSHVLFLMHLAHVFYTTMWLKVSQVRSHSIHMPSMMSHV